jgi:hypothetical protein
MPSFLNDISVYESNMNDFLNTDEISILILLLYFLFFILNIIIVIFSNTFTLKFINSSFYYIFVFY